MSTPVKPIFRKKNFLNSLGQLANAKADGRESKIEETIDAVLPYFQDPATTEDHLYISKEDETSNPVLLGGNGLHVMQWILSSKKIGMTLLTSLIAKLNEEKNTVHLQKFWDEMTTIKTRKEHMDKGATLLVSLLASLFLYKNTHMTKYYKHIQNLKEFMIQYKKQISQSENWKMHYTGAVNFFEPEEQRKIIYAYTHDLELESSTKKKRKRDKIATPTKQRKKRKKEKRSLGFLPHEYQNDKDKIKRFKPAHFWYVLKTQGSNCGKVGPGFPTGPNKGSDDSLQVWYSPLGVSRKIESDEDLSTFIIEGINNLKQSHKSEKWHVMRPYLQFYCISHGFKGKKYHPTFEHVYHRQTLLQALMDRFVSPKDLPKAIKDLLEGNFFMKRNILDDTNILGQTPIQTAAIRGRINWVAYLQKIGARTVIGKNVLIEPKTFPKDKLDQDKSKHHKNGFAIVHEFDKKTKSGVTPDESSQLKRFKIDKYYRKPHASLCGTGFSVLHRLIYECHYFSLTPRQQATLLSVLRHAAEHEPAIYLHKDNAQDGIVTQAKINMDDAFEENTDIDQSVEIYKSLKRYEGAVKIQRMFNDGFPRIPTQTDDDQFISYAQKYGHPTSRVM